MKEEKVKIRDIPPFGLRMSKEMRDELEGEAKKNGRSLNTEIVMRLKESMAPVQYPARVHAAESPASKYGSDVNDIERQLLFIFRRLPVEKQLALLSLFN